MPREVPAHRGLSTDQRADLGPCAPRVTSGSCLGAPFHSGSIVEGLPSNRQCPASRQSVASGQLSRRSSAADDSDIGCSTGPYATERAPGCASERAPARLSALRPDRARRAGPTRVLVPGSSAVRGGLRQPNRPRGAAPGRSVPPRPLPVRPLPRSRSVPGWAGRGCRESRSAASACPRRP
jgi:hypothetical protein